MADPPEGEAPLSGSILAEAPERGGDHRSNLDERLRRFAVARERALAMRDYIAALRPQGFSEAKAAHELHQCGTYLVFRHYLQSDRVKLAGMRSCKQHLICPVCGILRGAKMMARYLERFDLVLQQRPDLEAWMVTLTVKDGPDLEERTRHLHRNVKRLHKRRTFRDRYPDSVMRGVVGDVRSYETKRGSGSGLWHPHMHAVWLCERGRGPDQASLSREWHELTGDSFIVETHRLYGDDPAAAFAEVFKYAIKFADMELPDNWRAFETLRRRRMVASSGVMFGVQIPDELTDDLLDEPEWVELFFRFIRGHGYALRGTARTDADGVLYPTAGPAGAARQSIDWSAHWRGVFARRTA